MQWYLYIVFGFVIAWLLTMIIFRLKQRRFLFWISSVLPVASLILIVLLVMIVVLLPVIYLALFIYSLFVQKYETWLFGKRIKVS